MENKHEISATTSSANLFQNIGNRLNPMNYDKVVTAGQYFGSGIQKWRDGSFLLDINLVGRIFGGGSGGIVKGITPRRRLHGPSPLKTLWLQEEVIATDDIHDHCETRGYDDERNANLEPLESSIVRIEEARTDWGDLAELRGTDTTDTNAVSSIESAVPPDAEDDNDVQYNLPDVNNGCIHVPDTNAERFETDYERCTEPSASLLNNDYFEDFKHSPEADTVHESENKCNWIGDGGIYNTSPRSFHIVSEHNEDDCHDTLWNTDNFDAINCSKRIKTPSQPDVRADCCISSCASYIDKDDQDNTDFPSNQITDELDLTDTEVETILSKHEDDLESTGEPEYKPHPAFLTVRDGFVSCRILTPSLEEEIRCQVLEDDSEFEYLAIQDGRVCFRSHSALDREHTDAFKNDDTFSIAQLFSEQNVADTSDLDMGVIYIRNLFTEENVADTSDSDMGVMYMRNLFTDQNVADNSSVESQNIESRYVSHSEIRCSDSQPTNVSDSDMGVIYIRNLFIENKDTQNNEPTLNELFDDLANVLLHLFSEDNQQDVGSSDFERDDFNISHLFRDTPDKLNVDDSQEIFTDEETMGLTYLFCEQSEDITKDEDVGRIEHVIPNH